MAELSKVYEPQAVEAKWYAAGWPRAFSRPDHASTETGVFHGHAAAERDRRAHPRARLNNTIQDILARRARMLGKEVLWLPGTDHAGIGTQTAVEKHIWRTEKKTRHDLGREEFLRRVLEWQDKYGALLSNN